MIWLLFLQLVSSKDVILTPEKDEYKNNTNDRIISSTPEQLTKETKNIEKIENPNNTVINEENINFNKIEKNSGNTVEDELKKIPFTQSIKHGGAGGALELRFRGAKAFEPQFFYEGVPLSGLINSSQLINFLPSLHVNKIKAWPDMPVWYLFSAGIAGAIDFHSCIEDYCLLDEQNYSVNTTFRVGSFSFKQVGLLAQHKINTDNFIKFTTEYTNSKENYKITNNNGTELRTDDDRIEKRNNNDFNRFAIGFRGERQNIHYLGKLHTDILYAQDERGLASMIESNSQDRLNRRSLLTIIGQNYLSLHTGNNISSKIFFKYDNSLTNITDQKFKFNDKFYAYGLSIKNEKKINVTDIFNTTLGINLNYIISKQLSNNINYGYKNNNIGLRHNTEFSFFNSFLYNIVDDITVSSALSIKLNTATSNIDINCESFLICTNYKEKEVEKNIYPYSFSLQAKIYDLLTFIRYSSLIRRPFLFERFGSGGVVIANNKLIPEQSQKMEIGIGNKYLRTIFFNAYDNNLIFMQIIDPKKIQYVNLEKVKRYGLGLEADALFMSYINANFAWYFTKAFFNNPSLTSIKYIPRTPLNDINLSLSNKPIYLYNNIKFIANTNYNKMTNFYLDNANYILLKIPQQIDFDFSIIFDKYMFKKINTAKIALIIQNITNDNQAKLNDITGQNYLVEHTGFVGFPRPKRHIYFDINIFF